MNREFNIGEILTTTVNLYIKNIVPFGLLSIVVVAIPMILLTGLITGGPGAGLASQGLINIVQAVLASAVQAAITYGAFQSLNGREVSTNDMISRGLALILPVLGVALLTGIGIGIGFILLIVPGVFLMLMWYVAIPVAAVEKLGVIESIKRSAQLTEGYKGPILGLILIFLLILIVVGAVVGLLFLGGAVMGGRMGGFGLGMIVLAIFQALVTGLAATGVAVVYARLREIKDGKSASDLAQVFN